MDKKRFYIIPSLNLHQALSQSLPIHDLSQSLPIHDVSGLATVFASSRQARGHDPNTISCSRHHVSEIFF
jgi:hypothetical protein